MKYETTNTYESLGVQKSRPSRVGGPCSRRPVVTVRVPDPVLLDSFHLFSFSLYSSFNATFFSPFLTTPGGKTHTNNRMKSSVSYKGKDVLNKTHVLRREITHPNQWVYVSRKNHGIDSTTHGKWILWLTKHFLNGYDDNMDKYSIFIIENFTNLSLWKTYVEFLVCSVFLFSFLPYCQRCPLFSISSTSDKVGPFLSFWDGDVL